MQFPILKSALIFATGVVIGVLIWPMREVIYHRSWLREAKQSVNMDPHNATNWYNLGVSQTLNNQSAYAIVSLRKAMEMEPTWLSPYGYLQRAYLDNNQPEQALAVASQGIAIATAYHPGSMDEQENRLYHTKRQVQRLRGQK